MMTLLFQAVGASGHIVNVWHHEENGTHRIVHETESGTMFWGAGFISRWHMIDNHMREYPNLWK